VELLDPRQQLLLLVELLALSSQHLETGDVDHQLFALRQELVQRRIDGADGDRSPCMPLKTP
jgi:hypothetical protein